MRVDWQWSCVDTLNASIITASLNAALSYQGLCETKMSNLSVKKIWSMEYSKNLIITRRESKMNDWLKVFLIKSKIGQRYTAPIYPALSIQSISLNNAKIQNSRKIQYSRKICVNHFSTIMEFDCTGIWRKIQIFSELE